MIDNKPPFMGMNIISTKKCILTTFCLALLAASTFSAIATTEFTFAAVPDDTMKQKVSRGHDNSYKSLRIQDVIDRRLGTGTISAGQEQQDTKDLQAALASDWSPFIPLEGQVRSDSSPVVTKQFDGRLAVFVIGIDNSLYYKTQTAPGSTSYTPYIPLSGVIRANSNPAVALTSFGDDGRLSVFVIGNDHQLWEKHQLSPGSTSWSDYVPLGGEIKANTDPTAILDTACCGPTNPKIAVFVIGADNSLYVKWQTASGSTTYTPYEFLGGQLRANGHPAVALNFIFFPPFGIDIRLEVFVVGIDNTLYHKYETASGSGSGPWSPFESLSGQIKSNTSPDAITNFDDFRLEVFVIGVDNQLYNKWQTGPGTVNSYSPYQNLLGQIGSNTDPDVTENGDGRLEVFVVGIDNNLYHKWQITPSSSNNYSPFESLGGILRANTDVDAEGNDDGRLEVFIVGPDNQLYHKYRTTA